MSGKRTGVIGVIPARWGSTRLPGKALVPICGKPLIQWVLERVNKAKCLDEVVVATDDQRIVDAVGAMGGVAVMTRADHPSGTDRVAEAVSGSTAGIVINIQGDEPLIDPGLIDRLAQVMVEGREWDMATAATPILSTEELNKPSVVKVVCGERGRALYFSRSVIPFVRDAMPEGLQYWRHVGIYAYRREFLRRVVEEPPCLLEQVEKLEQLRALHIGAVMHVAQTQEVGLGVDTPEDVALAEAALRAAGLAK
jgi:3-deoxy-manno-octulosonate cytidylyltransferase (CMP-KDO synthetase)